MFRAFQLGDCVGKRACLDVVTQHVECFEDTFLKNSFIVDTNAASGGKLQLGNFSQLKPDQVSI